MVEKLYPMKIGSFSFYIIATRDIGPARGRAWLSAIPARVGRQAVALGIRLGVGGAHSSPAPYQAVAVGVVRQGHQGFISGPYVNMLQTILAIQLILPSARDNKK